MIINENFRVGNFSPGTGFSSDQENDRSLIKSVDASNEKSDRGKEPAVTFCPRPPKLGCYPFKFILNDPC